MNILEIISKTIPIPSTDIKNLPTHSAVEILGGVLSGIYVIVGAIAVVIIILSGFRFANASYDPANIARARNTILYSVIGLIVVILAFFITQFIVGRFK